MMRTAIFGVATLLLLTAGGTSWAQTGPAGSGATGAAQSQGLNAAPGSPVVGSGSGASTGAGLSGTGGLAGAGGPAAGAAAQSTNDPRLTPPTSGTDQGANPAQAPAAP